jgi:TPR repeat protein
MEKAARIVFSAVFLALAAVSPASAAPLQSGISAYNRDDYNTAARIFQPLAALGDARAQTYLGFMYANGRGVPQDYVTAAMWYSHAAEQGEPNAQFMLGLLYDKGHGVPRDYVLAHMWVNLAASKATGRNREFFARVRNAIASKLGPTQIAAAQFLAQEWQSRTERW